jgi:hypothetical protein
MSKKDEPRHPFANFLDKLAEQLTRLESLADSERDGVHGSGQRDQGHWSIGWKFSMGTPPRRASSTQGKPRPVEPVHKTSARGDDRPAPPQPVDVQPRTLGFFEVHDEGDHLLVIAELPGLPAEGLQAELTHHDVLTLSITSDGLEEQRDILLPAPATGVTVDHRQGIFTIRCDLLPRSNS